MKSFIDRYQFVFFVLLTFVFSCFPVYAGIGPEKMTMGSSFAALILIYRDDGKRRSIISNVDNYSQKDKE